MGAWRAGNGPIDTPLEPRSQRPPGLTEAPAWAERPALPSSNLCGAGRGWVVGGRDGEERTHRRGVLEWSWLISFRSEVPSP